MNQYDYQDFSKDLGENTRAVPANVEQKILSSIEEQMNPSQGFILLKLFLIHLLMGALTLLFCPQFQFSLTGNDLLYNYLHQTLGHRGCFIACGAIFMAPGALAASLIITLDEMNAIKKSIFLHLMAIISFSLILFIIADANVYFEVAKLWVIGAIGGSLTAFILAKKARFHFSF